MCLCLNVFVKGFGVSAFVVGGHLKNVERVTDFGFFDRAVSLCERVIRAGARGLVCFRSVFGSEIVRDESAGGPLLRGWVLIGVL